jgi:hypothetical protein
VNVAEKHVADTRRYWRGPGTPVLATRNPCKLHHKLADGRAPLRRLTRVMHLSGSSILASSGAHLSPLVAANQLTTRLKYLQSAIDRNTYRCFVDSSLVKKVSTAGTIDAGSIDVLLTVASVTVLIAEMSCVLEFLSDGNGTLEPSDDLGWEEEEEEEEEEEKEIASRQICQSKSDVVFSTGWRSFKP